MRRRSGDPSSAVATARCLLLLVAMLLVAGPVRADVMLQGFYWDVPSPAAGNASAPWWWDRLASEASGLAKAGFTSIWIPPVVKGASGGFSVGYDPFDDYDIGSKNQRGTIPTRYGTRAQLERCVAILRANGLNVYVDLVDNHRNGDDGHFNFVYADAYGHSPGGRFPKGPGDFHPNVPQDPDVPDGTGEMQFGRDLAPINGEGRHAYRGLMEAGDWLFRALGVQGCRLDDVKGISTDWLKPFLAYGAMKDRFAVGEFWDGDTRRVGSWVQQGMGGRAWVFDFPLRYVLKRMCDSTGGFDMAQMDHAGLAGIDPSHAVTFVENHDTDRSDPVVQRKMLAYAYILTSEGHPCVFYRDYSTAQGCYGLKPVLDRLLWINRKLAQGPTVVRLKSQDVFAFERTGGPHLLTALTDDTASSHTVDVATGFGPRKRLHDYAGNGPDLVTDEGGGAHVNVPSNATGQGYVCYSLAGQDAPIQPHGVPVTQEYEGAKDLDIPPIPVVVLAGTGRAAPGAVTTGTSLPICTLRVAGGTTVRYSLRVDTSGWNSQTAALLDVDDNRAELSTLIYRASTTPDSPTSFAVRRSGDITFRIMAHGTTARNPNPAFRLRVTYLAPTGLGSQTADDLRPTANTRNPSRDRKGAVIPHDRSPLRGRK